MPLDLGEIGAQKTRWISLSGALQGVDVEIKHVGPREQERWRQGLARRNILRVKDGVHQINTGRETDFFQEFAKLYVLDWRGDIKPEGAPYDHKQMGNVLGEYNQAFLDVSEAAGDETDFFSESGNGSKP